MRKRFNIFHLVLILLVVFVIATAVSISGKNKIVGTGAFKNSGLVAASASSVSAGIVTQYASNNESSEYSCDNVPEPRCQLGTVVSESHSKSKTLSQPYAGGDYTTLSSDMKNYSAKYAERYGLTSSFIKYLFDSRTFKTTIDTINGGPKAGPASRGIIDGPFGLAGDFITNGHGGDSSSGTYNAGTRTSDTYTKTEKYTLKETSRQLLVMNDKSDKDYKVTLSVFGRRWHLNKKGGIPRPDNGANPRQIIEDDEIPCTSFRVVGQKPNNSCQVTLTVKGGSVLDVTPLVPLSSAPAYTSSVSIVRIEEK